MPPSFYVVCREATSCRDYDCWRVIAVRDGNVVEGLNDFGYRSAKHAVRVYRKLGLPIYSPEADTGAAP